MMTTTSIEKRIEIERRIVRKLVRKAKEAGWIAKAVDDGGDEPELVSGEKEVLDKVFGVDEAKIYFQKTLEGDKKRTRMAFIVLGNDGWDCIADHSAPDDEVSFGWNEMMESVSEYADKLGESL